MTTNTGTMIVSQESRDAHKALVRRPEIRDMAAAIGKTTWDQMCSGHFMQGANDEARRRGVPGDLLPTLGSAARALHDLLTSRLVEDFTDEAIAASEGPQDLQRSWVRQRYAYWRAVSSDENANVADRADAEHFYIPAYIRYAEMLGVALD